MKYRITGTSRQIGAIGKSEPFVRKIFSNGPRSAVNGIRAHLSEEREHVHIEKVEELNGKTWVTVDPERWS